MLSCCVAGVIEAGGVCLPPADSADGKGDETEGEGGTGTLPGAGSEGEDDDAANPIGRAGVI